MDHSAQDNERPAKRPCLSNTPDAEDNAPEDVPEDFDLPTARAQNDSRLKSLFEGIFAKYSHDFTGVGDEIDLETGKIVVDNGHLLGMQLHGEDDNGCQPRSWLFQTGMDESETRLREDGADTENGDDDESSHFASSPSNNLPAAPASDALLEAPPSDQQQVNVDDPLDFVFTFKASGATGLCPVTKSQYLSHPTNPINLPNPPNPPNLIATSKPPDPIWAVPDLPQSFSTPTTETRKINVGLSPIARSPSPPGSGSVWAIRGPGRPRTEAKPKATPSRRKSAAKRKYKSSPVTQDWSFAEVPDGNESDDPLQEFEPSPTPSKMRIIRGKRQVPNKHGDGLSVQHHLTPSKMRLKKSTPFQNDEHDRPEQTEIKPQMDNPLKTEPRSNVSIVFAAIADDQDTQDGDSGEITQEDKATESTPQNDVIVPSTAIANNEHDGEEGGDKMGAQEKKTFETEPQDNMAFDSTLQPESTPTPSTKAPSADLLPNTPSKRRAIKPDEAKSIVRMMHKENKKASEVTKLMPHLDYQTVWHWFYNHWTRRVTNPPHLSVPWSHSELSAFARLSGQSNLSWAEIQREFPSRSRAEVEFELLRAFVDGRVVFTAVDAEHPVKQLDAPTEDQEPNSSQEVWVQAEEIKAESESEDIVQSIEDEHEVRGDSVSSSPTAQGKQTQLDIQCNNYANGSFVANSFLDTFIQ
jgi:hypothetical protein